MSQFIKKSGCIIAAMLLGLALTACRESPVLQQTVYMQSAPETDESQEMLDPEDEGVPDEQFENIPDEDADTARDSEVNEGLADETGDMDEAVDTAVSDESNNDLQPDDTPPPAQPEPEPDAEPSDTGAETPENIAGDEKTYKQVVDARGATVDLPENVESVTAVGAAAQLVGMLGGGGKLLAADEALFSSELARLAFADHATVQSWWKKGGISNADFAALLEAGPDACLELSGENTFSNAQVEQLQNAGIAYLVLPALSSHDNLKRTVSLLGEILGGDAPGIADAYNEWADGVVQEVKRATSEKELTSLYISAWDADAGYQLSGTKGVVDVSGSGLAVAYSPVKAQLVSDYMSAANVVNESTRLRSVHRDGKYVYVAPMFHQFSPVVSGTAAVYYSGAGEYGSAYDLFVARMISDTVYYQLGGGNFPAIIVASPEIKAQLENNWFWQYHPTDENGYITIGGQSFYCGVIGEYAIHVNPRGMLDWAEGGAESPLEAYWLASKMQNAYTSEDVQAKTREFYQRFFGVTLSDEQLSAIFAE